MQEIVARAKANKQRIVLPEGTEIRTLKAANQILTEGVAEIILIGNPAEVNKLAQDNNLSNIAKATIVDPARASTRPASAACPRCWSCSNARVILWSACAMAALSSA